MQFALKKSAVHSSPPHRGTGNDLKAALFHVLFGIEETWKLEQNDLAGILHRSPSTISDWKNKEEVSVSPERPSPNDAQIYELIEFYDSVSSLFVRVEDQMSWLKSASVDFGNRSPLELLKLTPKNLYVLREWIDHLARP